MVECGLNSLLLELFPNPNPWIHPELALGPHDLSMSNVWADGSYVTSQEASGCRKLPTNQTHVDFTQLCWHRVLIIMHQILQSPLLGPISFDPGSNPWSRLTRPCYLPLLDEWWSWDSEVWRKTPPGHTSCLVVKPGLDSPRLELF